MNKSEAEKISKKDCDRCNRLVDTDCSCLEVSQAISFLEGYEQGVREAANLMSFMSCRLDHDKQIIKLIEMGK